MGYYVIASTVGGPARNVRMKCGAAAVSTGTGARRLMIAHADDFDIY
jgi:hypothetical protein